jgi:hypothetical protein
MSQFQLTTELLKLSFSQIWDEAKLEWDLIEVEKVTEADAEECVCGKYPIMEICTIKNKMNNNIARVGNSCVKKFINKSDKIFRSISQVKKHIDKSLNAETISFAFEKQWITQKDRDFYIDIFKKRNLSEKQNNWKTSINKKILNKTKI